MSVANHIKNRNMKQKYLCLLAIILTYVLGAKAEVLTIYDLIAGHDYYIYNCYSQRVLGPSADLSRPRLMAYDEAQDAQYLFTAEAAPTAGYFLLRHKATGRYMAASTSDTYSVLLQKASGTGRA